MSVVTQAGARTSVPLVEVCIAGRLDAEGVPVVRAALSAAADLRPDRMVVDMAGCCGIDATGIALLLDTHRDLLRAGSALTLRAPSPRLRRTLAIARVANVLHIVPETTPPGRCGAQNGSAGREAVAVTPPFVVAGTDPA